MLDDDEFERLLAELPGYSRRIVLAAAETGMRASEIRRIRWEDVDLGAGELRVAVTKNKEFRVVPLTARLYAMLEEMRAELTPHPTAHVFEAVDIKKRLAAALKRAGIEKHVTLHGFRHQFATRALEAGMSAFHLQAIGGWKSPVMLQRYAKVCNKALHEQMAKLNGRAASLAGGGRVHVNLWAVHKPGPPRGSSASRKTLTRCAHISSGEPVTADENRA